jgi:hypothetical protein
MSFFGLHPVQNKNVIFMDLVILCHNIKFIK